MIRHPRSAMLLLIKIIMCITSVTAISIFTWNNTALDLKTKYSKWPYQSTVALHWRTKTISYSGLRTPAQEALSKGSSWFLLVSRRYEQAVGSVSAPSFSWRLRPSGKDFRLEVDRNTSPGGWGRRKEGWRRGGKRFAACFLARESFRGDLCD